MTFDQPTRCRSGACSASILWVKTLRGKNMPLDAEPVEFGAGTFVFVQNDQVRSARIDDQGPFWRSHFSTCQDAEGFRR